MQYCTVKGDKVVRSSSMEGIVNQLMMWWFDRGPEQIAIVYVIDGIQHRHSTGYTNTYGDEGKMFKETVKLLYTTLTWYGYDNFEKSMGGSDGE